MAAAQKEGQINLIALPDNWANYGTQAMKNTVIGDFYANYKITCNSVAPDDSSAQELAAIKADKGTSKEPDVVDVSPAIAVEGAAGALLRAVQGADLERHPGQHEVDPAATGTATTTASSPSGPTPRS